MGDARIGALKNASKLIRSGNPYSPPDANGESQHARKRWSMLVLLPIANLGLWILATQFTAYTGHTKRTAEPPTAPIPL